MIRTITLSGPLAAKFGHEPIELFAEDFSDLMRGLDCARPGFINEVRQHDQLAVAFADETGVHFLSEEGLGWRLGSKQQVFIGTSEAGSFLEGASAFAAWASSAASFSAASGYTAVVYAVAYVAAAVAMAAALGAVARSLADKPGSDGAATDERRSALFDRAVNLTGQGHPVPLLYGRFKCGSVVVSSSVSSERNAITVQDTLACETGGTLTGNVLDNDILGHEMTVSEFSVDGTIYSPGATVTNANFSVTIAASGAYTFTSISGEGRFVTNYRAAKATGESSVAALIVDVTAPYVWSDGGGGG